ncbi:unnamed protein product [Scytosiphon promiscuus]
MIPNMTPDISMMVAVSNGNLRAAEIALRAGASVDGDAGLEIRPLMICAGLGNSRMAKLLVERGADLEIGTTTRSPVAEGGVTISVGSRAIHTAISSNSVGVVRVLIDAGADLSTGDAAGRTPLMVACTLDAEDKRGRMVRLLLEAGADCTSRADDGVLALHSAASSGDSRVIDLLLSRAPSTLNHASIEGLTPLYVAAQFGHARVVEQLLSAGASNKAVRDPQVCPLRVATDQGHDDVVRVLLTPGGMEAIGGAWVIPNSITTAASQGRARIVHLLIGVEGDERRGYWSRVQANGFSMLHDAAGGGHLATLSVLLSAGASEEALGANGMSAADMAESYLPTEERSTKRSKAVRRVLARGPAFRAWSFAWPRGRPVTAGAASAGAADGATREPGKLARAPLGVQVFRGEGVSVRLMERYARKS